MSNAPHVGALFEIGIYIYPNDIEELSLPVLEYGLKRHLRI